MLLVHRRPGRRHYPDWWDLPGGHIEQGEPAEVAVRRECWEELGVVLHTVSRFTLACSDTLLRKQAFLVTSWCGTPRNMAPVEHNDLAWFTPAEVAGLTMADPAAVPDIVKVIARPGMGR